jgi:acyl-CoA reductase-like NAD-dependent aldehyde dehydrogenase
MLKPLGMRPFGMYINGSFVHGSKQYERRSPHKPDSVFRVSTLGDPDDEYREAILQGSSETFEQIQRGFFPIEQRREVLSRFRTRLENQSEFLAKTLSLEVAKPLSLARAELRRALLTVDATLQVPIESSPYDTGELPLKVRHRLVPRGPLLAITPFNFPVNLVLHKVLPALWSGNPVILKPSPKAHATAMVIADIFHAAHLPAGLLQVVQVEDLEVKRLAADSRVQQVSFTGSSEVGWGLAQGLQKPVTLELGGYAPVYIGPSAELRHAARACLESAWNFAGQSCISAQNLYVHPSIHKAFVDELRDAAAEYSWGDPDDESSRCACLIDTAALKRVEAVLRGAEILVQAPEPKGSVDFSKPDSPYFRPRIVAGEFQSEIFGPAAFLSSCDFDAFIERANGFEHRLQASVFTGDESEHRRALSELRFGGIVINEAPSTRWDPAPYGGFGKAGSGREGPWSAVQHFSEVQTWIERI